MMQARPNRGFALANAAVVLAAAAGCAATYEQATEADLSEQGRRLSPAGTDQEAVADADLDGSLESYLAAAMRLSPSLRASFERWRASVHRIPQARRLPVPTLTYGYFVRSVGRA